MPTTATTPTLDAELSMLPLAAVFADAIAL